MQKENDFTIHRGPIGIFDSGYGGLTILRQIRELMPQNDYIYLGDNARTPYGTRSYEVVYEFTLQAVQRLFQMGCHLVVLACNTASAKALRSIQQNDLPQIDAHRRVLGVIRPTAEYVGLVTQTRHVGIVATPGTIRSMTYEQEIAKIYPDITVVGESCPMWVSLVENYEYDSPGADYFIQKNIQALLDKDPQIDCIVLGCTHYPILLDKIRKYIPDGIRIIPQGEYVARSLKEYLKRHQEIAERVTTNGSVRFYTTEQPEPFSASATIFLGENINAERLSLDS